jgi:hypothetical protein
MEPGLVAVQPVQIGVPRELPDVPAKVRIEDDAAHHVSLREYESGQAKGASQCSLVMVKLGWQQNLLASIGPEC